MNAIIEKWKRVTKSNPCPICHKPDNCSVSTDKRWCWCGRIERGSRKINSGGQYLHLLIDDDRFTDRIYQQNTTIDFSSLSAACFNHPDVYSKRAELSAILNVSLESLESLQVGWSAQEFWTFPEKNSYGRTIGILRRYPDGNKRRIKGSQSGLIYQQGWNDNTGDVYLVEGSSDTACLISMCMNVIGRPSNLGGVDLLSTMLFDVAKNQRLIVMGENDQKPDGKWPGLDGAISTAIRLLHLLKRPILYGFPPGETKDVRSWVIQTKMQHVTHVTWEHLKSIFKQNLQLLYFWPDHDQREHFEERAAIIEYDGKLSRSDAEKHAYREVIKTFYPE